MLAKCCATCPSLSAWFKNTAQHAAQHVISCPIFLRGHLTKKQTPKKRKTQEETIPQSSCLTSLVLWLPVLMCWPFVALLFGLMATCWPTCCATPEKCCTIKQCCPTSFRLKPEELYMTLLLWLLVVLFAACGECWATSQRTKTQARNAKSCCFCWGAAPNPRSVAFFGLLG